MTINLRPRGSLSTRDLIWMGISLLSSRNPFMLIVFLRFSLCCARHLSPAIWRCSSKHNYCSASEKKPTTTTYMNLVKVCVCCSPSSAHCKCTKKHKQNSCRSFYSNKKSARERRVERQRKTLIRLIMSKFEEYNISKKRELFHCYNSCWVAMPPHKNVHTQLRLFYGVEKIVRLSGLLRLQCNK